MVGFRNWSRDPFVALLLQAFYKHSALCILKMSWKRTWHLEINWLLTSEQEMVVTPAFKTCMQILEKIRPQKIMRDNILVMIKSLNIVIWHHSKFFAKNHTRESTKMHWKTNDSEVRSSTRMWKQRISKKELKNKKHKANYKKEAQHVLKNKSFWSSKHNTYAKTKDFEQGP